MLDVLNGIDPKLQWEDKSCVGIVVAAKGYPNACEKGMEIPEFSPKQAMIVHAGTKQIGKRHVSDGGRVLLSAATAPTLGQAAAHAYEPLRALHNNDDFFYRTDIARYKATQV
jgi:phosphoribosylamine---glycine ligase